MDNDSQTTAGTIENIYKVIAREFGFDDLQDVKQQEIVERMTDSVFKRVLVDAYAALDESARQEFDRMIDHIDTMEPQHIDDFLQAHVDNYHDIIAQAVADLKQHIAATSAA